MQLFYFFIILKLVTMRESLQFWAVNSNCTRHSLDRVLGHLREMVYTFQRTLELSEKTPRSSKCLEKCRRPFKHFDIQKYIKQVTIPSVLKSGINDIFSMLIYFLYLSHYHVIIAIITLTNLM